jgi:hypothetical protein
MAQNDQGEDGEIAKNKKRASITGFENNQKKKAESYKERRTSDAA